MKKEKKQIVLNGSLLRPLSVGRGAILHAGGNIYHTSRVVAILEESEDCVRFETQNSHYYLSMSPFPLAAVSPLPAISFPADPRFLTSLYYGEYEADMCLYVTPECFDDPPKTPEIYNDATACVWRDGTWQLLEDTSKGFLLFVQCKSKEESAA